MYPNYQMVRNIGHGPRPGVGHGHGHHHGHHHPQSPFPVLPFLAGLAISPFLFGGFSGGQGYPPYGPYGPRPYQQPYYPPYGPYGYGSNNPNFPGGY